jgi:lipid-A-disaccharide synthase
MRDGAMQNREVFIFISAGEASGDLHGSNLVRALQGRLPQLRVACLGGAMLRQAGAEVLVDNRETGVVGLSEVFQHVQSIVRAWRIITSHLARERPALLVLIDFPDFNLLLARWAKRHGIRIFYYICPQLWAWRSGRTRTLKRLIDRMVVVLPFEPAFYASHHLTAEYVGHPLLDVLAGAPTREEARSRYAGANPAPVVGLLPGSRSSEIGMLLPLLLETAHRLHARRPDLTFLLPVAPSLSAAPVEQAVASGSLPVKVVTGDTYGVMRACDVLLTASGTATLEAAVLEIPMVIVYKVSKLSAIAGRHLIRVRHAGLPNLIAGRSIVPELLQAEARPERITTEALALLEKPEIVARQREDLARIRGKLGQPGVAGRVAQLVLEVIES